MSDATHRGKSGRCTSISTTGGAAESERASRGEATPSQFALPDVQKTASAQLTPQPSSIKTYPKLIEKYVSRCRYKKIVAQFYRERGYSLAFHDDMTANQNAKDLVESLGTLHAEGIDPKKLYWALSDKALARHFKWWRQRKPSPKPTLSDAENEEEAVKRDLRMADVLVEYVKRFRYHRTDDSLIVLWPSYLARKYGGVIVGDLKAMMGNMKTGLKQLRPKTNEYPIMVAALERYRALSKKKAPPRISWWRWRAATRKGKRAPTPKLIRAVQARLSYAGFYEGDLTGEFDETTVSALTAFQESHNLKTRTKFGWWTVSALNLRNKSRVRKLMAALQRLRESVRVRENPPTYVRVNLPAYKLHLHENRKHTRTHKVIIGNTKLDFDRDEWKQGYLNHSPIIATRMESIILNPKWKPPPRILEEEFNGEKDVVIGPGPKNPLGRVKFWLYRTNMVYIHDTNKRGLFRSTKRAYSHGCIRLHKARDLAKHLLERISGMSEEDFKRRYKRRKPFEVRLDTHLPVYFEYMTADVDPEHGRVTFYPDIYEYDYKYVTGQRIYVKRRFGDHRLRPKDIPEIPKAAYTKLKKAGEKRRWSGHHNKRPCHPPLFQPVRCPSGDHVQRRSSCSSTP